jgi:hypothetical protein
MNERPDNFMMQQRFVPKEATLCTEYNASADREDRQDKFIKVPALSNPNLELIYKKTEN